MAAQLSTTLPTNMAPTQPVPVAPAPAASRDSFNAQSLGPATNAQVKKARVLLVGAGGIGCELLKDLALTGFGEIHVVDLDTIDLSNLNRQFLFRQEHIKKSKALVATEVAQKFNPDVNIIAHHANIKDTEFSVQWFKGFDVVFNALDNLDARRHVNKMCLAADVPLIESGTTGFNGQVQVIKKGVTACYDCTPKETPKSFPVCTIRSTPSQPIHCIVWGKSYLLNEIFGVSEDESAFDNTEDQSNAEEIAELRREAEELRKIRQSVGTPEFPRLLFDKVFDKDILRLRSMEDMWKSRKPPEPLKYEALTELAAGAVPSTDSILRDGQRTWSLEENLAVFNDSLDRLSKRMVQLKKGYSGSGPEPIITFDKDDEDTLDFVTASANIRSTIFGIERKSRFDTKQMAGNIIPAIATTNAIVAGLIVLESFKVLRGEFDQAKEVFLSPFGSATGSARLLASDKPRTPNPECPVCSVFYTTAFVDISRATLDNLVEDFVRTELGYGGKEVSISNDVGLLYDPDETENLAKKLSELGIKPNTSLTIVDDDEEEPFTNVVLNIQEAEPLGDRAIQALPADKKPEIPRKPKKVPASLPETNGAATTVNGGAPANDENSGVAKLKRQLPDDSDENGPVKKTKITTIRPNGGEDDDLVLVSDRTNGAIVIED